MMKDDFKWDDNLVAEFATWSLNHSNTFQGRYSDIAQFKKSKTPTEQKPIQRPPLGIIPEYLWKEKRIGELRDAMKRYIDALLPVSLEWVAEYYDLTEWVKRREEEKHNGQ